MKIIRWVLGRIILILDFATRPKKMDRDINDQKKLDTLLENHSMYQFHTCPFCVKVRRYLRKRTHLSRTKLREEEVRSAKEKVIKVQHR